MICIRNHSNYFTGSDMSRRTVSVQGEVEIGRKKKNVVWKILAQLVNSLRVLVDDFQWLQ